MERIIEIIDDEGVIRKIKGQAEKTKFGENITFDEPVVFNGGSVVGIYNMPAFPAGTPPIPMGIKFGTRVFG